jgi:basic membrane lipoprotein Med (substrate-binding protein (PBP1-ABC) superfamily)
LQEEEDVELKMDAEAKKTRKDYLLSLLPTQKLKVAFIYDKTIATSAWAYSHELGRLYLEETFPDEVSTIYYENVTAETAEEYIEKAIEEGCDIIFTTTPSFAKASLKVAINHPDVKILNCSIQTSHRYIRTYYSRMFEAKFLMGAIAGAMAENNKLFYIADYPIFGTIANINAFALGAKMINPRAKVYLDWLCLENADINAHIDEVQPSIISGKDMIVPEEQSRYFGIYHMENGSPRNLAMSISNWGKFYERLIRRIMDGTWKYDDSSANNKAINYWWGMSAEVVDVIFSQNLPIGTRRLIELLRKTICSNEFAVFSGVLYSQEGSVQDDPDRWLTPEEIAKMDWLAENVIGHIPTEEELTEAAKPVVSQQGLDKITLKKDEL